MPSIHEAQFVPEHGQDYDRLILVEESTVRLQD